MMLNIAFLIYDFCGFSMCESLHVAVNVRINYSFCYIFYGRLYAATLIQTRAKSRQETEL